MPHCRICKIPVRSPKAVAAYLERQLAEVPARAAEDKMLNNQINYPGRAGGYEAAIQIAVSELRGLCWNCGKNE